MSQKRLQRFLKDTPPIVFLIIANLIIGLISFQDFGLSIDEPLFYGYGEAIGYAYSPAEWLSADFDLTRAYGPSPGDHANRGPGYLLFARIPALLLQNMGLDMASAWHLVNFLAFQIGLYFFYLLCLRWIKPWPAFWTTAFLSAQPILWGHAFINPKDPPFLAFFLITLELGFRMAERLANPQANETKWQNLKHILLPAIMLGLTTNIRVLGPLAAALAGLYFLTLKKYSRIWWYIPYGLISYAVMVITWPFLWEAPIGKFIDVVRFMSNNPTTLQVYFYGATYTANDLPTRYLPAMMIFTLTEPVWLLASAGFIIAGIKTLRNNIQWRSLLPALLWLAIPMLYVLLRQPPMYDGFRHFLFIAPPLFILSGVALDAFFQRVKNTWAQTTLILALLLPGIIPIIRLHPYQYTYYNQFVGRTGQAAQRFETDYWLTCYKEAVAKLGQLAADEPVNLFVRREAYIAEYYAPDNVNILQHRKELLQPGDYVLFHSRGNPALQIFSDTRPYFLRIEHDGAIFCEIRKQ